MSSICERMERRRMENDKSLNKSLKVFQSFDANAKV